MLLVAEFSAAIFVVAAATRLDVATSCYGGSTSTVRRPTPRVRGAGVIARWKGLVAGTAPPSVAQLVPAATRRLRTRACGVIPPWPSSATPVAVDALTGEVITRHDGPFSIGALGERLSAPGEDGCD